MKGKKIVVSALVIIVALAASYVILTGFTKRGGVFIADYSVSEDGTEMNLTVGVATSIGYVRKVSEHQQQDGTLYLDCYSAFGGINGSWGAKSDYTIQIDEDTERIAIYHARSSDGYDVVLEKDENGEWQRVTRA